jgi:hypothetical protein
MNDSDKVLEIYERVLLLDSQIEAIKDWILSQPGAPTPEWLDSKLFDLESGIRNGQKHRGRFDEFQRLVQAQDDPAKLVQLLRDHILYSQNVTE